MSRSPNSPKRSVSSFLVAPLVIFSLACAEPAGAENAVGSALGGGKKSNRTTRNKPVPHKIPTKPAEQSKPTNLQADLLAQAKQAGWSSKDVKALKGVIKDVESLSPTQTKRALCRVGKVFQTRKPLYLVTLREAGATKAELKAAGQAIDDIAAAMCSDKDMKGPEAALGRIFLQVNARLTTGTSLEGHNVTLEAFEDLMREMNERCGQSGDALSYSDLAGLTDAQFDARLGDLAFGGCSQRSTGSGGVSGLPSLPAGSDGNEYAQCVRSAFHEGVTSTPDCQNIAGGDGDGDGDTEPEPDADEPNQAENPNHAANEHDRAENAIAAGEIATGTGLVLLGAAVVVVGAATSEVGVGVAIAAAGIAIMGSGAALGLNGVNRMGDASSNFIERNGRRASWSLWSCPAMSTPVGSFGFSNPSAGPGSQPHMTVMDAMRACRCENNPLDDFLGGGAMGAFGGPSCELGSRLDCLRQSGDDMGTPPSPECRRMLHDDNQASIAAQLHDCMALNCGDGLVGDDCSCWGGSSGGAGGGSPGDPCAMVRCPEGAQPVPEGSRCTCNSTPGGGQSGGPSIDCIPGTPGCGTNNFPGGLPGGGKGNIPLPQPIPNGLPKPIPKPMK